MEPSPTEPHTQPIRTSVKPPLARRRTKRPADPVKAEVPPLPPTKSGRFFITPQDFVDYWHAQHAKHPDRLSCYYYRVWPITNKDPKYIGIDASPIGSPDPAHPDKGIDLASVHNEMLHRYGSGDYKLLLKDSGRNQPVAETKLLNLRDSERPPIIELRYLVMDDPANRSYIENLRQKGVRLPGDTPTRQERQEEDEMGNAETVRALAETIESMADKVVESGRQQVIQQPAAPPDLESATTVEGIREGIRVVKQAADIQAEMLKSRQDPVSMFREVAEIVKQGRDDGSMLREVLQSQKETTSLLLGLQDKRIEAAERVAQEALSRQQAAAVHTSPAIPPQVKTLREQLQELKDIKALADDLLGRGSEGEEGEEGEGEEGRAKATRRAPDSLLTNLPLLVAGVTGVFGLAANIMHNLAVARSGQGAPAPPPAMPAAPQTQEQLLGAAAAAAFVQPGPPDTVAGAATNPYHYHQFLERLRPSFLYYLSQTRSGADYADYLIEMLDMTGEKGRLRYDAIREMGKEILLQLFQSYPPIWNEVASLPQRLDAFLDEFMNRDAIREREEVEDEELEEQAGQVDRVDGSVAATA